MISPEAIGRGFDIEYRQTGFSEGLLDFSNNQTDNELKFNEVTERELYMALGVSPNVDIFYKVPKQSVALLGLKVQVMGAPSKGRNAGHKLAFTVAGGAARDSFEGAYDIKIKADASEFSVIHGYRFSPMLMVYEGFTYSKYTFSGKIENAGSMFESDSYEYVGDGILGLHAGLEFGGETFKLKVEYATQRVEWSNTDPKYFQSLGYTVGMTF